MTIRALHADDFDAIHRAFIDAFSDYVVPMHPTADALREMFTRRGWVPELSSGIFEDERIVAFTLNGFDGVNGYDTGSGVIPTHRRRGLARKTIEHSIELLSGALASSPAEQAASRRGAPLGDGSETLPAQPARRRRSYILEVLEPNTAAIALYRGLGFVETRRLDCWTLAIDGQEYQGEASIHEDWWDVQTSWQNSTASIHRAKDRHVLLGDDDGYAVVFPATGDVPQLAVRREARRRGIGTKLMKAAAAIAQKPLRLLNIDVRDEGIAAFLVALGAKRFVRQIEMEFVIQTAPL